MKWNKYRIKTTTAAEDIISYTLGELGVEGVEIEDKIPLTQHEKEQMFIDILPELGPDDGSAYVSFYIEPEKDSPEFFADIMAALDSCRAFADMGELSVERTQTADVDWMNNWKQYWKPFEADEGILIKPSWEKVDEDDAKKKLVIELDPGTAFGTGMHHTTKLCIRGIRKYLQKGQSVFDVGCGSGILSIIAVKLGAGYAAAVDVDPNAVEYTLDNARKNGVDPEQYTCLTGDIISDAAFRRQFADRKFDLVVANILAEIIIPLSGVVGECLAEGGVFVSSGILASKEAEVSAALKENGFEILEVTHSGDWIAIAAARAGV